MAYLRAKISDLIEHDERFLRWRLLHGDRKSCWYVARRATVTFPPAARLMLAELFIEIDTGQAETRICGPYLIPMMCTGDTLRVGVELH